MMFGGPHVMGRTAPAWYGAVDTTTGRVAAAEFFRRAEGGALGTARDQLPVMSYLICASYRTGSQMLCDRLRSTKVAGWPAEYYLPREEARRYRDEAKHDGRGGDDLRIDAGYLARTLRSRVTRNGVFGMQVMQNYFEEFVDWLGDTWPGATGRCATDTLAVVFPNLRYVHLSRRDKARQAVSLIKAKHTKVYGREGDTPPPFSAPFDFELMQAHIDELERQDGYWRNLFATAGIEAIAVAYEDLDERPDEIVTGLLHRLGIAVPEGFVASGTRLRRQANVVNDEWVTRYWEVRAERDRETAR
jgi:trehalose 2-sulfotransferase